MFKCADEAAHYTSTYFMVSQIFSNLMQHTFTLSSSKYFAFSVKMLKNLYLYVVEPAAYYGHLGTNHKCMVS